MSHTPLGEVCLALGLMRPEDVDTVLARLRDGGRTRFGEIAIELGLLDDEGLARALAQQFRLNMVPPERLGRLSIAPEVLELLPRGLVRERLIVPTFLDEEKRVLSLLTVDPTDIPSLRAAQTSARAARLRLFVAPRAAMRELIDRLLPPEDLEERPRDRATVAIEAEPSARGISVVFEPDPDRAAALRRLEAAEGGAAEIVGDPEQVSAFIEANQADRVFFRRAVLPEVEPYLSAWRRLRPLVQICALDGYGPSRRVGIPYDRTRDFFFGLLEHLVAAEGEAARARGQRSVDLARAMSGQEGLPDEQRDAVVLAALFAGLADDAAQGAVPDEAAGLGWAADLLRAWSPPYGVDALFEALIPRVRGETAPGRNAGAEILFTARAAARAGMRAGDDPVVVFGADAARHDADALRALAAVLHRWNLREQVQRAGEGEAGPASVDTDTAPPVDTDSAAAPEAAPPAAEGGGARAYLPGLLGSLRRVLQRRSSAPVAISGRLSELALVDLLQTLTLGGRTAQVNIVGAAELGMVQVREGRIVAAAHGPRTGEEALHSLVAGADGRFEVRFEDTGLTNLAGASEFLMIEAVRRRDERRA